MKDLIKRLDLEWMELILTAKRIGLTVEEVREFLQKKEAGTRNG